VVAARVVFGLVASFLLAVLAFGSTPIARSAPSPVLSPADRRLCVSETNRYRAMLGVVPVKASVSIESYADRAAANDHARNRAHHYSRGLNGPKQTAWAENEGVRWPLNGGSTGQAIAAIIAAFWAEGPGGAHYETMRHSRYVAVGCGGYAKNGTFTLVQHFRTSE
jgi:uncharacterized protein YkwD